MAYKIILVRLFSKLKAKPGHVCLGTCLYFFSKVIRSAAATLRLCKTACTSVKTNRITKYCWSILQPILNPYSHWEQARTSWSPPAPQSWQAPPFSLWASLVWASAGTFESGLHTFPFLVCHLFSVTWPRETDPSIVFQTDHDQSLCQKYFLLSHSLLLKPSSNFPSPTQNFWITPSGRPSSGLFSSLF